MIIKFLDKDLGSWATAACTSGSKIGRITVIDNNVSMDEQRVFVSFGNVRVQGWHGPSVDVELLGSGTRQCRLCGGSGVMRLFNLHAPCDHPDCDLP